MAYSHGKGTHVHGRTPPTKPGRMPPHRSRRAKGISKAGPPMDTVADTGVNPSGSRRRTLGGRRN